MATEAKIDTNPDVTTRAAPISLDIYKTLAKSRTNHGVHTDDFDVYRKYLTKQLSSLRKKLKLQCLDPKNSQKQQNTNAQRNKIEREIAKKVKSGKMKPKIDPNWNRKYKRYDKKKDITWRKREIRVSDLSKNPQCLLITLLLSERAWAFAVSIYEQYDEDNKRKYHHSNSRLRKAITHALSLYNVLKACNASRDTLCESFGYLSWLRSTYFLQIEEIESAYEEYLKCIQISPNNNGILALESNPNEKLAYFEENIDNKQRIAITNAVDLFMNEVKVKEMGIDIQNDEQEDKEDADVFVEFDEHKVQIPNIANLKQLITQFYDTLKELKAKQEQKLSPFKKEALLTSIVLLVDASLRLIQTELKRSESGSEILVIEKYLLFEKLRFSVCRQWIWMQNKSRNTAANMLYQLAVLSEIQIENLDELSAICDLSDFGVFVTQIDILRNLFEISRKFYIAKIHFVSFKNYLNALHLFEHHVIESANDFIVKLDNKWDKKLADEYQHKMYDFAQWIDILQAKEVMKRMLMNSKRLSMKAKALYVLNKHENKAVDDLDETLIDTKDKLYPLLSKPYMIDIAWNYIDYHIDDKSKKEKETQPKQKSSWFGTIFGGN